MPTEINRVAKKFKIVVTVIKILGYGYAILSTLLFILASALSNMVLLAVLGIVVGLLIAIGTWLACLMYEAIAEGLQLLQDIKNK